MIRRRTMLRVAIAAPLLGAGAATEPAEGKRLFHAEPCMGTLFRMTVFARDEAAGYEAIREAFVRVHALDAALSDYREESELMRLCREGWKRPVAVSAELFAVLDAAVRLAHETDGLFDPTLGRLTRLWRVCRKQRRLPSKEALREARLRTGYRQVELDAGRRTVHLRAQGMMLDLGGIAKGYAADTALGLLRKRGFPHALVAAGGDIAAGAPPFSAAHWKVAVEPPLWLAGERMRLALARRAVSTSGDRQQFVVIDGQRYSHIVDPRTGLGLTDPIAVSAIAPTAMESDSLATACSVMGKDAALAFLQKRKGFEGVVLTADGRGQTAGFAAYLAT